jgi:hypothetical protein
MVKRPVKEHKDEAQSEIELDPDAWPRFEQFIKTVAKAGPKHRPAKAKDDKAPKGDGE